MEEKPQKKKLGIFSYVLLGSDIIKELAVQFAYLAIVLKALKDQVFKTQAEHKIAIENIEKTLMFHEYILEHVSAKVKLKDLADKFEQEYGANKADMISKYRKVVH